MYVRETDAGPYWKMLQSRSTVSFRSTRIAEGRKQLELESPKVAATLGPYSSPLADPKLEQHPELLTHC
jgi:hypothetical protein